MSHHSIWAICLSECRRASCQWLTAIGLPIATTALYLFVFQQLAAYTASAVDLSFMLAGLTALAVMGDAAFNSAAGTFLPRFNSCAYEYRCAPVRRADILAGFVLASSLRGVVVGLAVILTAGCFVKLAPPSPLATVAVIGLIGGTGGLLGLNVGFAADGFEKLHILPTLVLSPLAILGGAFFPAETLPPSFAVVVDFNTLKYAIDLLRVCLMVEVRGNPANPATCLGVVLGLNALLTLVFCLRPVFADLKR